MIFGDPFYFALQFEVVASWNVPEDTWKNGIFSLYLKGNKLFDVVDVFELKTILGFHSKTPIKELIINDLNISAIEFYRNAENYFTGDNDDLIEGLFDMSCTAMGDNGCYLYFIKTSIGDRLVWSIDDGLEIKETILPSGTILKVIHKIHNYKL